MQDLRKVKFEDKQLGCTDCEQNFTFSAGEQRYLASKGLRPPKRCPKCRLKRKLTLVPEEVADG